jgi:hypothetical protein
VLLKLAYFFFGRRSQEFETVALLCSTLELVYFVFELFELFLPDSNMQVWSRGCVGVLSFAMVGLGEVRPCFFLNWVVDLPTFGSFEPHIPLTFFGVDLDSGDVGRMRMQHLQAFVCSAFTYCFSGVTFLQFLAAAKVFGRLFAMFPGLNCAGHPIEPIQHAIIAVFRNFAGASENLLIGLQAQGFLGRRTS